MSSHRSVSFVALGSSNRVLFYDTIILKMCETARLAVLKCWAAIWKHCRPHSVTLCFHWKWHLLWGDCVPFARWQWLRRGKRSADNLLLLLSLFIRPSTHDQWLPSQLLAHFSPHISGCRKEVGCNDGGVGDATQISVIYWLISSAGTNFNCHCCRSQPIFSENSLSALSSLFSYDACPGPAVQRQVQNGPTSEEIEAQRARWVFLTSDGSNSPMSWKPCLAFNWWDVNARWGQRHSLLPGGWNRWIEWPGEPTIWYQKRVVENRRGQLTH